MTATTLPTLSLTPPTLTSRALLATFKPSAALNSSTNLSFEFPNGGQEIFLDRITHSELDMRGDGSVVTAVPNVPVFKRVEDGNERATEVRMSAWEGGEVDGGVGCWIFLKGMMGRALGVGMRK
jgi:hypothetical protein